MPEHIKHLQTPGVFGTHVEILSIATFYGVPVFYCQQNRPKQGQHAYSWHCVGALKNIANRFHFPNLSGSPLEQVTPPCHFELSYTHNTQYDSIVTVSGELCKDFPQLNDEEVYVDLSELP